MDLQPSAPCLSASSFPSPTQFQMNGDPLLSLEKLHDFCQGGSTPLASNAYARFPFPNFSSSTKVGIGIDLTSELYSASSVGIARGPNTSNERIRSSAGPYFSPNKIAYRSPGTGGGVDSSPPALPSLPTSGSSTLQGILQRYGLGSNTTLDVRYNKNHQQDFSVPPAMSACITQKIRNLDEILRNLDHYSVSKRFAINDAKDLREPLSKKRHEWQDPNVVQDMSSEQQMSSTTHNSGTLGGSVILDGITHINKSISRMEFKSQMEKLTDCIDDRWPESRRVGRVEKMDSKTKADAPYTSEPTSVGNFQNHPQVEEDIPSQPTQKNASNAFAGSTNILEEMMRNITGLERRLAKRDKSKQTKQKGFLAKGRLWVQRPTGKKMAAKLQKQFKRHAASINARLDKTDLAIKSLRRQREEAGALSPALFEGNYHGHKERKVRRVSRSSSFIHTSCLDDSRDINNTTSEKNLPELRTPTVAEKCMEACEVLSRSMQQIQNQICALQRDSQNMGQSMETIQKQSNEQNMEIELCWTAINHLCIDNETFREELQVCQSGLQQEQQ